MIQHNTDGTTEGRDPRTMTQAELRALGHEPMPVLSAIRAHCLDCCAGSPGEVRHCTAVKCPSWPYRMGTNPWRKEREISDENREAAAARLRALAAARRNPGSAE